MSSIITKRENGIVSFEMTVDSKTFDEAMEVAYKKTVKRLNIPGFRKGKAPRKLVEMHYGEGVFYDDAIDVAFNKEYFKAIDELQIQPVQRPSVDVKEIGAGKDLVLLVEVAVKPEADVKKYKGLEMKKSVHVVEEKDLLEELDTVREKYARVETLDDKALENGNIAVINFEGFIDGAAFEGGKGENFELEIGSGTFIEGFEDQLVGKKTGEEVEVNVTFPENYHAEALSGKPAMFKVKINEVKVKQLPELDDEFVKDISEFETLEEFKADTKKHMEERAVMYQEREEEESLLKSLVENTEVEVPQVMVEGQIDNLIRQFSYTLYMQGLDLAKYMEITGMKKEDFREGFRNNALEDVKTELALEKIQALENLSVSDEDVEKEIADRAEKVNQKVEEFKNTLEKQYKDYKLDIQYDLLRTKTIKFLKENATVVE